MKLLNNAQTSDGALKLGGNLVVGGVNICGSAVFTGDIFDCLGNYLKG